MAWRSFRGGLDWPARLAAAALLTLALASLERVAPRALAGASPDRPNTWKSAARATIRDFRADNISFIAAGVAYHVMLAAFPAMAVFVALYGLAADVHQIPQQLRVLALFLPRGMVDFIGAQMIRLAQSKPAGLSLTLLVGLLVSLWSANGAARAMIVGLDIAFESTEKRTYLRLTLVSLALTVGLAAVMTLSLAALAAGTVAGPFLGERAKLLLDVLRWPFLLFLFAAAVSLLYRFGPCRPAYHWRPLSPGSAAATLLWLAMSALFSLWMGHFAHYDRTYGPLGAAIGLMVYAWLSAMVILAGAELQSNAPVRLRPPRPRLSPP